MARRRLEGELGYGLSVDEGREKLLCTRLSHHANPTCHLTRRPRRAMQPCGNSAGADHHCLNLTQTTLAPNISTSASRLPRHGGGDEEKLGSGDNDAAPQR